MSTQPDTPPHGMKIWKLGQTIPKTLLLTVWIILLGLLATAAHAQSAPAAQVTPWPSPTYKACHICDEDIIVDTTTPKPDGVDSLYALIPTVTPAPNKTLIYLFWGDGCPHCETVKPILREMAQRYPNVEVREYEVWYQPENEDLFVKMAAAFGFEPHVVPTIFLGGHYWEGFSEQDKADMESMLAVCTQAGCPDAGSGIVPAPTLPDAQPGIEQPTVNIEATPTQALPAPPAGMRDNGFVLAIAVMIGMAGTLVYTGVRVARGVRKDRPSPVSETIEKWRNVVFLVLCLIGLGVAGYLAYVEIRMVEATCGPVGDCNAVQASAYARLFGLLPVGVLGMLGYLAILAAWGWSRLRHDRLAKLAPLAIFGMTLLGTLFSLYLTYLEPFLIGAVCAWCITSAVIMTLLLLLSLDPALRSLIGDTHDQEESS